MPPKRKAVAAPVDEEPPHTRRRTRATATTVDHPEEPALDLPPARTRRRAKTTDEGEVGEKKKPASKKTAPASKPVSRTTRARSQKGEAGADAEAAVEAGPSAPRSRTRSQKVRRYPHLSGAISYNVANDRLCPRKSFPKSLRNYRSHHRQRSR